ncbi:hypothetical protein E3J38_09690 [candidate division TA06 bacterium]|uniref:Uncharacterized protein n=1 Tax=candidate division TA06 bacterium TaxID=2250710 RepID=A0A523XEC4_UNCT6|nr:MAG: hypothetical protein E3J38_09690 [candidate division TA06 bacterium]
MEIDNVVFLGGGASASEGAPPQDKLFRDYFNFRGRCGNQDTTSPGMDDRIGHFFKSFFGIDVRRVDLDAVTFPTFEEALGMTELALDREESFKGFGMTPARPDLQRLREDLIFLIAIILKEKLSGESKHHIQLVDRLDRENRLLRTGFISLNYDILVDNALMEPHPRYYLDYGIEYTNYDFLQSHPWYWERPIPEKSVTLCKLHGSLNWLYCPTCITLTLTPKEKRVATLIDKPHPCDACGTDTVPIIIPPTFFKVMSNFYLQQVWRKAENLLHQAARIIFCGYSFPDADIHVKYLLKRVELNRSHPPEVFVVNECEEKSEYERKTEKLRFKRFFADPQRVHYMKASFQDFCQSDVQYLEEWPA